MNYSMIRKPYFVLGLDIGIGSIGWCLLDLANEVIVDMGVHLWEVPQEPKTKMSTCRARRLGRSSRNNTDRHQSRMKKCREMLQEFGLVPSEAEASWFQTRQGDLPPLCTRVNGLDRRLTDRELAMALYNICNRRGYIPHGMSSVSPKDEDGKKVLKALDKNEKLMLEKGYRTVAEMMFCEGRAKGKVNGSSRNKGKNDYSHCVRMSQLIDEVDAIFAAQRSFGNPKASERFQSEFKSMLAWEKPTYGRDEETYQKMVGRCIHYPLEKRAARACPSHERCCAFERLCNVRIVMPDGSEKSLPASVRRAVMEKLFSPTKKSKVTFTSLRSKMLNLPTEAFFKGVESEKEEVFKPNAWRKLCNCLPKPLVMRFAEDRDLADSVVSALVFASTEQSLRERLNDECLSRLSGEELDAICAFPFNDELFHGYGSRSLKALHELCDAFEDYEFVDSLSKAKKIKGLLDAKTELLPGDKLPPYVEYDPVCTNPVVLRVMGRVRKLVNALVDKCGIPDEIHIELANDLKHSKHEKDLIKARQKRDERENAISKKDASEILGCGEDEVPGEVIRKLNLYREQGGIDLYTGDPIKLERLIKDPTCYNTDHILPYCRTCDDSRSNKVLTLAARNQEKGSRSPYEWLSEEGKYEEFKERVLSLGSLSVKKIAKLLEEHLGEKESDFISRNINDTRMATRRTLHYLDNCLLFPQREAPNGVVRKKHVCAVSGGATSKLRYYWGFEKKDREANDLHHAVDAAIIAACREESVKKVAACSARKHQLKKEDWKKELAGTEPWKGFSQEVEDYAKKIIPTRKIEHGTKARLFEDDIYRCSRPGYLVKNGKEARSRNYIIRDDGTAVKPDGIAFLRLWWDLSEDKYLKEPVYYCDIKAMKDGKYIPRYCVEDENRFDWPVVPPEAIEQGPAAELRRGVLVLVGGELLRFHKFEIGNGNLIYRDPRCYKREVKPKKGIGKAKSKDFLKVVGENMLHIQLESLNLEE